MMSVILDVATAIFFKAMLAISAIGAVIAAVVVPWFVLHWILDEAFKKTRAYAVFIDWIWNRKEFKAWLDAQQGPICDACGKPITEDQENVGHDCDLHKECAGEDETKNGRER